VPRSATVQAHGKEELVTTGDIARSLRAAAGYLSEHPEEARYTDSVATAVLEERLRVRTTGPAGEEVVTDMPASVGGGASGPSPGWLFRAALASCNATLIAMNAALEGLELDVLEVAVDGESDDRGILGIDEGVPAGPLNLRVRVRVTAPGADPQRLRELVVRSTDHCPVHDAASRAVPVDLEMDVY
jgi:uncharacterized OsmC-like protein